MHVHSIINPEDVPERQCIYCGSREAMTRDHIIPVSYTEGKRHYDAGDVVPCCEECNRLLGDRPIFTVEERAAYLADALAEKHKKVLRTEDWDEDELEEMDATFQSMIRSNLHMKEFVRERISNCIKTSCGYYDESMVEHLRHNTTYDKAQAYHIIHSVMFSDKRSLRASMQDVSESTEIPLEHIRSIVNSKLHESVMIGFMYDFDIPFGTPPARMKSVMYRRTHQ